MGDKQGAAAYVCLPAGLADGKAERLSARSLGGAERDRQRTGVARKVFGVALQPYGAVAVARIGDVQAAAARSPCDKPFHTLRYRPACVRSHVDTHRAAVCRKGDLGLAERQGSVAGGLLDDNLL